MDQKSYLGKDAVKSLREILKTHEPSSIFFVTGRGSYDSCGIKDVLKPYLDEYAHVRFCDFSPNPKIEDIEKGITVFQENDCDFVIAVGGGSVLDVAKSVNILSSQDGQALDYILNKKSVISKGKPFVAIPTTSGSGSEATHFAVVYVDKTKYSLAHEHILPDYAIVDPVFTAQLPAKITAVTGMDALCQAIESYWSVNSTEESRGYAAKAIPLVLNNLGSAVNDPSEESREAMAIASHFAGKAINISKTTASHAISYPITSFFGIPHGYAVALTIPSMIEYNLGATEDDVLDERGIDYAHKTMKELLDLLGAETAEQARLNVESLMKDIGLSTRLEEVGITRDDLDVIIKNGFNPGRVKNNLRRLTETALRGMLEGLL